MSAHLEVLPSRPTALPAAAIRGARACELGPARAAQPQEARRRPGPDGLPAPALSLYRLPLTTALTASLRAFGRRRLLLCRPEGGMTAFGPRLSLAPSLIRGRPLPLQAGSSRASEGPRRLSTARPPGSGFQPEPRKPAPAALDHGLDRQLDHGLR